MAAGGRPRRRVGCTFEACRLEEGRRRDERVEEVHEVGAVGEQREVAAEEGRIEEPQLVIKRNELHELAGLGGGAGHEELVLEDAARFSEWELADSAGLVAVADQVEDTGVVEATVGDLTAELFVDTRMEEAAPGVDEDRVDVLTFERTVAARHEDDPVAWPVVEMGVDLVLGADGRDEGGAWEGVDVGVRDEGADLVDPAVLAHGATYEAVFDDECVRTTGLDS